MNKKSSIISIFYQALFSFLAILTADIAYAQHGDTELKNRSREGVMAYLKKVVENKQVIVGQQCSETPDVAANYKNAFESVYDSTGKYPALLGLEYGYFANMDLGLTNQFAIDHWKKGGLVTISWHADNPFTEGYDVRWNAARQKDSIHIKDLLKNAPGSKEKSSYRAELTKVAKALKQLQDAGVTVLWRPFHEVNGTWFWWGANDTKQPTNQQDYQALWQDMYETFTKDHQLKNLIWVYSPFIPKGAAPIEAMYPGDGFVDIVAADNYSPQVDFEDYKTLKAFDKLVVNGEVGPAKETFGKFDELLLLDVFKGKAAYFLQWHSWNNAKVSISDNLNAKKMMHDKAAITLDKIK